MEEVWKVIPNHPNYSVSDLGNIKNLKTGRVLKPMDMGNGYRKVQLNRKFHNIHRIVMSVFIGDSELQVNHKNGIRNDNRMENLEYVTARENTIHSLGDRKGTRGIVKKVYQKDTSGNIVKIWKSLREASKILGIPHQSIGKCCKGISKHCSGYSWSW